jgi:hypothetical protein
MNFDQASNRGLEAETGCTTDNGMDSGIEERKGLFLNPRIDSKGIAMSVQQR